MAYSVAKEKATGLYWGGGRGGENESFCIGSPADAVAFGDAHRDYLDISADPEEFEWEEFSATTE